MDAKTPKEIIQEIAENESNTTDERMRAAQFLYQQELYNTVDPHPFGDEPVDISVFEERLAKLEKDTEEALEVFRMLSNKAD